MTVAAALETGDAAGNFVELMRCFSWECTAMAEPEDSTFFLGIALAAIGYCAWLTGAALDDVVPGGEPGRRPRWLALLAGLLLWLWLLSAYVVPQAAHLDPVAWMFLAPFYTAVLFLGLVVMAALVGLVVTSVREPGFLTPARVTHRLLLYGAVIGILIGWRAAYTNSSTIADGPFDRGPAWLQDLLDVWVLDWPLTLLWRFAELLTTVPGIAGVAAVCFLALLIPEAKLGAPIARGAIGVSSSVVAIVVSLTVSVVVGFIALAAAAFAFLALVIYALWLAIGALVAGSIISSVVRR